jgi:excisionase family DNA binding protein
MAAEPRFLTLPDVADVLNISTSQAYALVRNEELEAIKIGGRGQWRVERAKLEDYIQRMYVETREFIASHPFPGDDSSADAADRDERAVRD